MKSLIFLRITSGIHFLFVLIWVSAIVMLVLPQVGKFPILLTFIVFPAGHIFLAIQILRSHKISLIITLIISTMYLLGQIYYGFKAEHILVSILLVYNIIFPMVYLLKKDEQ